MGVTTAVLGAHSSCREDAAFGVAEISVEDLTVWPALSVFSAYHGACNGMPDGTGAISVKPVEAKSVTVNNTEYRLEHTHTLPFWDWSRGKTVGRMRDVVSIRVRWAEPSTLKTALEAASLVQDLIALATHRGAGVIWLQLELAGTKVLLPDGRMLPPRRAHVLYSPVAVGKPDEKAIDPGSVLFYL